MNSKVRRIFAEKKPEFDGEAKGILHELKENLRIKGAEGVRVIHRYDIEGITDEAYYLARAAIFSEPPVDLVHDEEMPDYPGERVFAWEYLPGQYDQRADSAAQAVQILTHADKPLVKSATVIAVKGTIKEDDWDRVKSYIINPVDSQEAGLSKPESLSEQTVTPDDIEVMKGFTDMDILSLKKLLSEMGLAMDLDDISFCQDYFCDEEKRDPTITELRIIDTYWSDHCRHTTFLTEIDSVEIEKGAYQGLFQKALDQYKETRAQVYSGREAKPVCLMDLATIAMKRLKQEGKLSDLDESDEINACSIVVPVDIDGKTEDYLVQFKNETHNHPTEIEPFGGAATCIGGAIRDPLSGRAYVYQAMRVTGSGDPRTPIDKTISGKLPQRKITTGAAHGYSSYGNQIGLATGHVAEIYDEGYVAKRMEIGAVIGAVPKANVVRQIPEPGDLVILLGGRTGRDGCGGATGSSKSHTEESIHKSGAEVQKGNAPEERKIQRLFRKSSVTKLIKRCNDFGAGGVSVAVGELADGLRINLDCVPKKYEGLDGTELAISESQERMAVVTARKDAEKMIIAAAEENLEATVIAEVTKEPKVVMYWRGKLIVSLKRDFLNSNGAKKHTTVKINQPAGDDPFHQLPEKMNKSGLKDAWLSNLSQLNAASQKGLVERFDGSIGAGSVTMPFGGRTQMSPMEAMVARIPLLSGSTNTGTVMAWGFDPRISRWSPFHGAVYSIVESVAKVAATGADSSVVRLTLQEYFEKLGKNSERWGKPYSALLGSFYAQMALNIPAIGGKDSMSGTFNELNVPPTLVSFALGTLNIGKTITPELKKAGSTLIYLPLRRDSQLLPDWEYIQKLYRKIHETALKGKILASSPVRGYGIAEALSKMAFGNRIGIDLAGGIDRLDLFGPGYGSLLIEMDENGMEEWKQLDCKIIGKTIAEEEIRIEGIIIPLTEALKAWTEPLAEIFPPAAPPIETSLEDYRWTEPHPLKKIKPIAKPRVLIPVFPGTNCEYDSARAFEKAGAVAEIKVFRNRTPQDIDESIREMVNSIHHAQMIMFPGGFSAGDEPEGSGKFIAAVFRNPHLKDAVMELLKKRDGLILGVCNGFQALIKLGLVPYGEIRDMDVSSPTLTYNTIGRHMSCMVRTRVASRLSPWFSNAEVGEVHTIPISHGEGRFIAGPEMLKSLKENGQIATQYVDDNGHASNAMPYNPNGSLFAIEGITSPDGRVLGKMAHSERTGENISLNIPGNKFQRIFDAGVAYYR